MPNYFAHGNKFYPPKGDKVHPTLDSVTGILISCDTRPRKNTSGYWFVFRLKKIDDFFNIFFEPGNVEDADLDRYTNMRGKTVSIRNSNERPIIVAMDIESEESLRATLLKGVAAGNIKMDDLPVLIAVAKGNDVPFEKWDLFKQQIVNEGIAKVKEEIVEESNAFKQEIEKKEAQLSQLKELLGEVNSEKEKMLAELYSALLFLQGDTYLVGSDIGFSIANRPENLVPIGDRYEGLITAFEKFRTKMGVYVVTEDKIHLIHDAYLEKDGRVFLLGKSKEFRRTKSDDVRQLIDRFLSFYSFPGCSSCD